MKIHLLPAIAVIVPLAVLSLADPARAFVKGVSALPALPTVDDRITVHVEGEFPTPCWTYDEAVVTKEAGEVTIKVVAEETGGACLPVTEPYSVDVDAGYLEAGEVRIVVADPQDSKETTVNIRERESWPSADLNGDGATDLSDAVSLLEHLFIGGPAPACPKLADTNGDGGLDLSDAVFILAHLFLGGDQPHGLAYCGGASACAGRPWLVKCHGHWTCDCGDCQEVCGDGCGDGVCDRESGETSASCPADCPLSCQPVCDKIGTRSEGWYDSCTGKLIDWALCEKCQAECRNGGTESEGWYDSCTDDLIIFGECDGKP